uniref:Uncharacterized protein n=1 Tax=viral metagenome TaxID=1070528 RepID=A0A6M3JEJ4_9ZZZZ
MVCQKCKEAFDGVKKVCPFCGTMSEGSPLPPSGLPEKTPVPKKPVEAPKRSHKKKK